MSLAQGPDLNRLSLALKLSARSSLATSMAGLGSWSGRKSDGLNWRPKHSSGRRWHRVGGRPAGGLFLAALVILPHCATRQESFVLLCQVAQGAEQLPRLELEARQLPQTRKDKFGWPFHNLIYGRFLMPRCDVKHTTTRALLDAKCARTQIVAAGSIDQ